MCVFIYVFSQKQKLIINFAFQMSIKIDYSSGHIPSKTLVTAPASAVCYSLTLLVKSQQFESFHRSLTNRSAASL